LSHLQGLEKSIATKDAPLQTMIASVRMKAEARRQQICKRRGVEASIEAKIKRLKELNVAAANEVQFSFICGNSGGGAKNKCQRVFALADGKC
jgi:hypothetical protein